jgi:hypothetical protein
MGNLNRRRRRLPAILVGSLALGLGAASASAQEAAAPSAQDLQAQIKQLQQQVADLQAKQQAASTAATDATVAAVMRDADRRSQLLAVEGFTAGYTDRGFVIRSADGDFLMHPYVQSQFRYVANYRDDFKPSGEGDSEDGFELRRVKFGFEGNLFGPNLDYTFQWQTDRHNGAVTPEDAWVRYRFADMWAVRAGQFKDPVAHEGLTSSMKLLAADRSYLDTVLFGSDDYIEGASLIYDLNRLRAEVAFTNGFNSSNSNFVDPVGGIGDTGFAANNHRAYNFGVAGRAEYLFMGDAAKSWKEYTDFTALNNTTDMLVGGLGGNWSQSGDTDTIWQTVDVQWEPTAIKGLDAYAAYMGRYNHVVGDAASGSFYDWGWLVQAGYLINSRVEPFARADYLRLDEDFIASAVDNDIYELTVGMNYYLKGNNAKFTADLTYLPNGSPLDVDAIGVLAQPNNAAQWVARLQFQLVL